MSSSFAKLMLLAALSLAAADGFAKGDGGDMADNMRTGPVGEKGSIVWLIILIAVIVILLLVAVGFVVYCCFIKEKKEVVVVPAGTPVTV